MKILVFVKQVPDTDDVKLDPKTGNIMREGVASKLMEGNTASNLQTVLGMMGTLFETNIPLTDILTFAAGAMADPDDWNIVSCSVDGTGDTQVPYSMSQAAYVMVPDMDTVEHAKELMDTVLAGGIPEV